MPIGPRYIFYIDEAGDDGRKARALEGSGSSPWFVLGGILVPANREKEFLGNMRLVAKECGIPKDRDFHFARLNNRKRRIFCEKLSEQKSIRWFCVASHKRNIIGYTNNAAKRVSGNDNDYYNFIFRLLIERVTDFCSDHNKRLNLINHSCDLKIIVSSRGGVNALNLSNYLYILHQTAIKGTTHLKKREVDFSVLRETNISVLDNSAHTGLQSADIVVSAIFKALKCVDINNKDVEYASLISGRAGFRNSKTLGEGLLILPWEWKETLSFQTQQIINHIISNVTAPRLCDPTGRL